MEIKNTAELENIYRFSSENVRRSGFDELKAEASYSNYVKYVNHFGKTDDKSILDVGCGNGWSSYFLAKNSNKVTGIDIHSDGFEPKITQNLTYKQSSAMSIDFPSSTFDVVTTHECLEHIPNPELALNEFDRVLKPGGYIIIVGPNLFSLLQSIRGLMFYVWKNRPLSTILFRNSEMPKHPHGNTLPEVVVNTFKNIFYIFRLYFTSKAIFKLREPDLRPPFHADNDACYFLNPLDLKYFYESRGYQVLNISGIDRSKYLAMVSSGTWFAARKPYGEKSR